ncbi:MAG: hydroxymethylglutaryl-CoA lyase [Bacteroidetes bacterium]|nr:hydroxymethylglutaryl-CoA lyase [Bacteroidota bacterium]MCW5895508.1 hydroxymethylglutaryl-CoA lyase [Bacteroidota bacterium]
MKDIIIHEVGMRDGLQMEKQVVPLEKKIEWIERLIASGVDIIQVGSFVRADKVLQMADTDKLFSHFLGQKPANTILSALVLNEKGLERALECDVEMICMGVSASETHSKKNTGMSVTEATGRIIEMAKLAGASGRKVQVSVQSAFGCGYEGHVPQERVMKIVEQYLEAGLRNISLADTAGHATPDHVEKMFSAILEYDENIEAACHFHNTYGLALANCYAAMKVGVTSFESSVAGLGGCPFTKIAGGNTCTEDFVHMLHQMGLRDDLSLDNLITTAADIALFFGREMPGMVHRTGRIIHQRTQEV